MPESLSSAAHRHHLFKNIFKIVSIQGQIQLRECNIRDKLYVNKLSNFINIPICVKQIFCSGGQMDTYFVPKLKLLQI